MESSHWPLILIEGVLVFGGALAFGWWQLRSVKRDRERLQAERERQRLQDERESRRESAPPLEGPPKDH